MYIEVLSTRTEAYVGEIYSVDVGKLFYQSSGSSELLQSVDLSLSLLASVVESISQQIPLSGAQKPDR